MQISIEDFKTLPTITGSLNLKWTLLQIFPDANFQELIERLEITYQVKYLKNLEDRRKEEPDFDEGPVWQYIPRYKVKYDNKGLSVFLVSDIGPSHGFLFEIDKKNQKLKLLN